MDYIKILPRCETYLLVNYEGDYFRLLAELSANLNWIRTFFQRAATCYSEGKTYRDIFRDEEWETAMETLSDVTIKVLGYSYTVNASDTYQKEDVPVYLIYSFNDYPLLAMSITSPLMELVRSIGGDLETEIEAELDREEFYQKIESI